MEHADADQPHRYSTLNTMGNLMYVCPCIIYEIEERYPLDATIYLFEVILTVHRR